MTSPPDLESRFPVGSSARMITGRLAIARAIATRWRSPPDSCAGRCVRRCPSPTRSSATRAASRRSRARSAGVEHPVGDVVDGGHRLLKVEALEHEPDLVGAQPGELDVRRGDDVAAGDLDRAAGRPLERAEHGQHRGLARARRADDRDLLAGEISTLTPRRAWTPPGYSLITSPSRARRWPARSSLGVGHLQAGVHARARDLDVAGCEQPGRHRDQPVRRRRLLHRIAAARGRQQRGHRHRQHV